MLAALDRHLADRQLHVIAPPGSGKTVLGLEALRRLGRPALVLAPTLTIREQWIERLQTDFLCTGEAPGIARDPLQPAELTFLTYQGLYQLFRSGRESALFTALREAGVGVIAADEAHHLRSEWWRCLDRLKSALPEVHTLCLTATPPYDAPMAEWRRYSEFAGDVDEEIGVPELVREGSLCPHQDLVLLFPPSLEAERTLEAFSREMACLPATLCLDRPLIEHLAAHPAVQAPQERLSDISAQPQFWLAVAVLLGNTRWESARPLLAALGLAGLALPGFDLRWAELLLRGLLLDRLGDLPESQADAWRVRLRTSGALHRRQLMLREHPRQARLLGSPAGMIDCVAQIVAAELDHFGAALRAVVLTDHVRAQCLDPPGGGHSAPEVLGVAPIFEHLRRLRLPHLRPALLTGSLVVIAAESLDPLRQALAERDIHVDLSPVALPHAAAFVRIDPGAGLRQALVAAMTALFSAGEFNLLCGTSALLGEGWDAPATNSLVLASTVAAHVSSNQLRGRAIRTHADQPHKCSNIWHLCAVQKAASDAGADRSGDAPRALSDRFRSFVGLHSERDLLESGLQRIGDCRERMSTAAIDDWNRRMFARAAEVHGLAARWQRAIGSDRLDRGRQIRALRVSTAQFASAGHWRVHGSIINLIERPLQRWAHLPLLGGLLALLVRRRLRALARALIAAMAERDELPATAHPRLEQDGDTCRICLPGVEPLQSQRFLDTLSELFDPLSDPRYLLHSRQALFAVPARFGRRKADAEAFCAHWRRHVAAASLIYTRTDEGRLALLRAKESLLVHLPDWLLEQRSVWLPQG